MSYVAEEAEVIADANIEDVYAADAAVEVADTDIAQTNNDIEDAQTVVGALDDINAAVGETPLEGPAGEAVAIATESLLKMIGYKHSKLSLENYGSKVTTVRDKVNKAVTVAQEGMVDKIKGMFGAMLTSEKSLKENTDAALAALKTKGSVEGNVKDFSLSSFLAYKDGVTEYTGTDLVEMNTAYSKVLTSANATALINNFDTMINKVVDGSTTIDKDIIKFHAQNKDLFNKINEAKFKEYAPATSFKALTTSEAVAAVAKNRKLKEKVDSITKSLTDSMGKVKEEKVATEAFAGDWGRELLKTLTSVGWWVVFFLTGGTLGLLWLAIVPLLRALAKDNKAVATEEHSDKDLKKMFNEGGDFLLGSLDIIKATEKRFFKSEMALLNYIKASTAK